MNYKLLLTHMGLLSFSLFAVASLVAFGVFNTFSWHQTGVFATVLVISMPISYVLVGTGSPKNRFNIACAATILLGEIIVICAGAYYLLRWLFI